VRDRAIAAGSDELRVLVRFISSVAAPTTPGGNIVTEDNATYTILLGAAAGRFNGYYFETGQGPPGLDPVRWVVEASTNGNGTWHAVGASTWRIRTDGTFALYPWLPRAVPEARGAAVVMDPATAPHGHGLCCGQVSR
jgi:hypothetical protein